MKVKNVNLCDKCEKMISNCSCTICKKDLCERCMQFAYLGGYDEIVLQISSGQRADERTVKVALCYSCAKGIRIRGRHTIEKDSSGKSIVNRDDAAQEFLEKLIKQIHEFSIARKV